MYTYIIHIYFIWVLYLPLNLCLSMPTKSRHISLKCQFYSACECLSVCMCVANVTASQKRARTSPKWHCDQIYYENMNGLYKMWYSHEMNDEWFMAFHFEPFPCVFASILYITLATRFNSLFFSHCTLHLPYSILQLNYIIVIAFILFMYIYVSLGWNERCKC